MESSCQLVWLAKSIIISMSASGAACAGLRFNIQIAHAQGNARVGSAALLLGIIMLRKDIIIPSTVRMVCVKDGRRKR